MAYRVAIDIGGTFTDLVLEDDVGPSGGRREGPLHARASGRRRRRRGSRVRRPGLRGLALRPWHHGGPERRPRAARRGRRARRHPRVPRHVPDRARAPAARCTTCTTASQRRCSTGLRSTRSTSAWPPTAPSWRRSTRRAWWRWPRRSASVGHSAVAVCLLHAYADPRHELEVGRILAAQLDVPVVLSHAVAPEWREYERTLDRRHVGVHHADHEHVPRAGEGRPARRGAAGPGLHHRVQRRRDELRPSPTTRRCSRCFSGPVGGVVGARAAGAALGIENLITIDMGGTSFDVSLVREGEAGLMSEFELVGLPVLTPAVEVHTIGAGGGSLIRESRRSALASVRSRRAPCPGRPATAAAAPSRRSPTPTSCSAGSRPTSSWPAAWRSTWMPRGARSTDVGERLGLGAEELAEQALEIAHFSMAEAIRELTVERGLDPRDFVLCAFGGAGGLHAIALAEELEIARVLVPIDPRRVLGLGDAPGRHPARCACGPFYHAIDEAAAELSTRRRRARAPGRRADGDRRRGRRRHALRGRGGPPLRRPGVHADAADPRDSRRDFDEHAHGTASRFHQAYHARYGHASTTEPVEFVAIRVAGIAGSSGPAPRPTARRAPATPPAASRCACAARR